MNKASQTEGPSTTAPRKVTLERTWQAHIDDVWELWTTKDGIEAWWGPEGFTVKVSRLELRAGGSLEYAMTATAPEQVGFMKAAGMPLTTQARVTFTDVTPKKRLAFESVVDFIPGVQPYAVATAVEFHVTGKTVKMVLSFDAMHEAEWTSRATTGRESELGRLERALKERSATRA